MMNRMNGRMACAAVIAVSLLLSGCSREARKARYYRHAQQLEQKGKLADAALEYRNALQLDANYFDARFSYAKLLLRRGDVLGSAGELRKAATTDPKNVEVHQLLARIYLLGGAAAAAKNEADAALALKAGDAISLTLLGNALLASKNVADAEKAFEQAMATAPTSTEPVLGLAACRSVRGDRVAAEKFIRQALQIDSKSVPALLALATVLESNNQFVDAEHALEQAETIEPKNIPVLMQIANFYSRRGDESKLVQILAKVRDASQAENGTRTLLADYYVSKGDYKQAISVLRALVDSDGFAGAAAEQLGEVYLSQNDSAEVEGLIKSSLAQDKRSVVAAYLQGRLALMHGDAAAALTRFREASDRMRTSPVPFFYTGIAQLALKQPKQAREAFSQALQVRPDHGPSRALRARLELQDNDNKAALQDAKLAVQIWPSAQSWTVYIDALIANGDRATADALLKKIIENATRSEVRAGFRAKAAILDLNSREYEKARSILQDAKSDVQGSSWPEELIAASYLAQQHVGEAQQVLTDAQKQFPESISLKLLQARTYQQAKKFDAAAAIVSDVLQKDPTNAQARLQMAQISIDRGDWSAAAVQYGQLGRERKLAGPLVMAGAAREHMGDPQGARREYEEALKYEPDNVAALNNLSYILLGPNGNVDQALKYAERAKELKPDAPEITDTLAWAYYQKNRYEFAVDLLERAVRARPDNGVYQYHLAKCYLAMNDRSRGKDALQKALRMGGDFPRDDASRELQTLQ